MQASLKQVLAALVVALPLVSFAQTPAADPAKPADAAAPQAPAQPAAPAPEPAKPAAAPAPLVQVYGTLNVNLQYTQASGATASNADVAARWAIGTDSTNVGVRGTVELLSPNYKGVYQCETQANLDGEDVRALCNRNSRVGISAPWGTLWLGNWDTPYKNSHYGTKADDPFGNTDVFGFQGVMGSPGYGVRSSAFNSSPAAAFSASFDQRAANSVGYWSPKFNGLSAKVQYSVDELSPATGTVRPQLLSVGLNFDMGPLSIVATAEYHEDAYGIRVINTANSSVLPSKDLAWRLAAGYELGLGIGKLTLMGMFEQLQYGMEDAAAGFKDYSRMAWVVGAKFRAGDHELRARYSQALAPSITPATGTTLPAGAEDNLGAMNYSLGYAYHFGKTTQLFLFYTQIKNEDAARYAFGLGGAAAVAGNIPAGSDPTAAGGGIRLAF